jgi:hypothetical protein
LTNEQGIPVLDQYLLSTYKADRKPEEETSNYSEVYQSFFAISHFIFQTILVSRATSLPAQPRIVFSASWSKDFPGFPLISLLPDALW